MDARTHTVVLFIANCSLVLHRYAIEDVGLAGSQYETAVSPGAVDKSQPEQWGKVTVALRTRTSMATAEHTCVNKKTRPSK
jgi:hypothetical protein